MNDGAYTEIRYLVDDPVAVVTLDRPSRMNAFTAVTLHEIRHALERSMADRRVVGTVITGAGDAFCVGLDATSLAEAAQHPPDTNAIPAEPALFSYIRDLPKPVIAAVNGMCAGGGFVLALMCDLRFAAEDAVFTAVFSKRGLVAEHATSWLLPRLVGSGRALDLLWSSRRVSGSEAVEMGLAERLAESGHVVQMATAYVKDLAESTSPRSLTITKELVHAHWSAFFRDRGTRWSWRDDAQPGRTGFRRGGRIVSRAPGAEVPENRRNFLVGEVRLRQVAVAALDGHEVVDHSHHLRAHYGVPGSRGG